MSKLINEIRYYNFISGVVTEQQIDPLCQNCKAFANTIERMREGISHLQDSLSEKAETISPDMLSLLHGAQIRLEKVKIPNNAVGQKKAGRCAMPEGVCFIKNPKAILDRI